MRMNRIALASVGAICVLAAVFLLRPAPPQDRAAEGNRAPVAPTAWSASPPESPPVESTDEIADFVESAPSEPTSVLQPVPLERNVTNVRLQGIELEPASLSLPSVDFAVPVTERDSIERADAPKPVKFAEGHADKSLRNADFPRTFISAIHVDLTSPNHWVELTWSGPQAGRQETGPFRSSPGAGLGHNDCDDMRECNRNGSNCTPKGTRAVEAFSDYLPSVPTCRFVTWFMVSRQIAFHSHRQVPRYPASHGCVRLDEHAAQLIHNNSLIGETHVTVDGTWTGARSW